MLEWYKDDEVGIFFDKCPDINILYPCPYLDNLKSIDSKSFINIQELNVSLMDYTLDEVYDFKIKSNYTWDGATIPRIFWRLIGAKSDPKFLIPSMIHDVLCENHSYINDDRYFSTIVFERLLYVSGVNSFNRWMIKHSVDNYQKLFGGW